MTITLIIKLIMAISILQAWKINNHKITLPLPRSLAVIEIENAKAESSKWNSE